jgi:23S rRNA (guanosine2251-2'-O)-methyltransferase
VSPRRDQPGRGRRSRGRPDDSRRSGGQPPRRAPAGGGGQRGAAPERTPRPPVSRARPDGLGGEQVEGRQAVLELLRAGRRAVRQVTVAEGTDADGPVAELVALAERRGVPVRRAPRGRVDALAGTEAPQGVVAVAEEVPVADLEDLARRPAPGGAPPLLVVLDGVTDPHNLGAIMRTAVGAGASGVVLGRHRSARLTPAAVKAAAGAVEHLPVALVAGIPAALRELAAAGVWTVGLDADAPAPLWDLQVGTEPVAVVLGAEGRGLGRLTRDVCEVAVAIPLTGPLGSLNVSAAAALACFEVARARSQVPPTA